MRRLPLIGIKYAVESSPEVIQVGWEARLALRLAKRRRGIHWRASLGALHIQCMLR